MSTTQYKAILGQLTSSQRWYVTITRLFYGVLAANLMIHTVLFMYVLPVLVLPLAVWTAAQKGGEWHGSQFPRGHMERRRDGLHRLYRRAAITGLGFSVVLGFMDYFASFFGTYLITVVGICFLTAFFFTKGLLGGWALVVDPADTATTTKEYKELSPVNSPVKVQQVAAWNTVFIGLTFALAFNVFAYKDTVLAADSVSEGQPVQQAAPDALAVAMSDSSATQTPDQAPPAPAAPEAVSDQSIASPPAQAESVNAAPAVDAPGDDVESRDWPKMTPCIRTLQDKFVVDQQKQNADTTTSLEQMREWADVCKSLGQ